MATRTARTAWQGSLQEGSGQAELTSSGVGTFPVSFPKRTADSADGTTSPEELIAAAHSSCFAMALSHELGEAGHEPERLDVTSVVTLDLVDDAPTVTTSKLTVRGRVPGIDQDEFEKYAQGAGENCPISRALGGVDIQVDAKLEDGDGGGDSASDDDRDSDSDDGDSDDD
jgi:osmotically inducible protein OsmC